MAVSPLTPNISELPGSKTKKGAVTITDNGVISVQVNANRAETTNKRRVRSKGIKQAKYDARSLSVTTENNNHALSSNPHLSSNVDKGIITSVSLSK